MQRLLKPCLIMKATQSPHLTAQEGSRRAQNDVNHMPWPTQSQDELHLETVG